MSEHLEKNDIISYFELLFDESERNSYTRALVSSACSRSDESLKNKRAVPMFPRESAVIVLILCSETDPFLSFTYSYIALRSTGVVRMIGARLIIVGRSAPLFSHKRKKITSVTGSSSIFKKAFCAWGVILSASSIIYAFLSSSFELI